MRTRLGDQRNGFLDALDFRADGRQLFVARRLESLLGGLAVAALVAAILIFLAARPAWSIQAPVDPPGVPALIQRARDTHPDLAAARRPERPCRLPSKPPN